MKVFKLKEGNTLPVLEVQLLHNGVPYDATGGTGYLHIVTIDGVYLRRSLTPTIIVSGIFQYTPLETDWDPGSSGSGTRDDPFTVGGFEVSPFSPAERGPKHRMEYQVVGPLTRNVRFPDTDEDNDVLDISPSLGEEP